MADAHLRSIAREAAQGDPQAAAELLWERVRVGELGAGRLHLAAELGHAPARLAMGREPDGPQPLERWVERLCALPPAAREPERGQIRARVAVASARAALGAFERLRPGDARPRSAIQHLERWILDPCERHGAAMRRELRELASSEDVSLVAVATQRKGLAALLAAKEAVLACVQPARGAHAVGAARFAAQAIGEERVRAAIGADCLVWALDRGDPLQQRRAC